MRGDPRLPDAQPRSVFVVPSKCRSQEQDHSNSSSWTLASSHLGPTPFRETYLATPLVWDWDFGCATPLPGWVCLFVTASDHLVLGIGFAIRLRKLQITDENQIRNINIHTKKHKQYRIRNVSYNTATYSHYLVDRRERSGSKPDIL